ncbi:MAG: InlB B-repeat-containing protein, partial [Dethiobacteria bacterium]|nr:InlB B-repeat-containing protein [Dethiobacteria bacterium]
NWDNRLGDASNAHVRSAPVLIASEVQEAFIQEKHAFAIDKDGSLFAWGNNNKAQLGNGSESEALTPESVALENVTSVYTQDEHTFALKEDGTLWAWGSNANGQLGIGSFRRQSTPVQVILDDDLLTHIVSLSSEPQDGGTLDGGGTYRDGESVTVTATANPGYTFTNWTENNHVISTNTNLTFLAFNDRYLVANFVAAEDDEEEITIYEIKLNAFPAEGGTVNGAGSYASDSTATVKATANEGYSFIRWNEKDEKISSDAELSFKVLSDRELTAIFEIIAEEEPEAFTLTLTSNPSDSGTLEGSGEYEESAEVPITAVPAEGYEFVNWTLGVNGEELSTEAAYTYTMPAEAVTLVANFDDVIIEVPEPKLLTLTLS